MTLVIPTPMQMRRFITCGACFSESVTITPDIIELAVDEYGLELATTCTKCGHEWAITLPLNNEPGGARAEFDTPQGAM